MKIAKVAVITILIIILAVVLALFVFVKTFDINRYRAFLVEEISSKTGKDISIGRLALTLSFAKGTVLDVYDLSGKDKEITSPEVSFSVKHVRLGVDLNALLTHRKIIVTDVLLYAPHLQVKLKKKLLSPESPQAGSSSSNPLSEESQPMPDFLVKSIRIENGTLEFHDFTNEMGLEVTLDRVNTKVEDFSLKKPFTFQSIFSLWSQAPNVDVKGTARLDLEKNRIQINTLSLTTDLSSISPERIIKSVPSLNPIGSSYRWAGDFKTVVEDMIIDNAALKSINMQGGLSQGKVSLLQWPIALEDIQMKFQTLGQKLEVSDFSFKVKSGQVGAKAVIDDFLGRKKFDFNMTVEAIPIGELVSNINRDLKFEGQLNAALKGEGRGIPQVDADNVLNGKGRVSVENAKLVDVNVLELVLSRISMIPGLVERIDENLPDKYRKELRRNDTIFKTMTVDLGLINSGIVMDRIELEAESFVFLGRGSFDWNQYMTLEATVFVPEDLSKSMVLAVSDLGGLLDNDRRLRIPLSPYQGKASRLKLMPDVGHLVKSAVQERIKQEIQKVKDKALGRESDRQGQEAPPGEPQQKSPEEEIIDQFLDVIFQ